jgi:hypothetical protein
VYAGTTGEGIINALSLGAELTTSPSRESKRSLQTVYTDAGTFTSRRGEDDKAEVLPNVPEEAAWPDPKPGHSR